MVMEQKQLKFTVVGDGEVGKTCLLIMYTQKKFPDVYTPTIFDNRDCKVTVNSKVYNVVLWDTAGQEEYERLRALSYPDTDCFLLCYSITSRKSYDNIVTKWCSELRHHTRTTPIVLVATKIDLANPKSPDNQVTSSEGVKLKTRINAFSLVECSAKTGENVNEVFSEAVMAVEQKVVPVEKKFCRFL